MQARSSDERRTSPAEASAASRHSLLRRLQARLELPMLALAFVWIALFVIEAVWGSSPALSMAGYAIWALFVAQFAVELVIAPRKAHYLEHNWLTALALVLPAFRLLRMVRIARVARLSSAARTLQGTRLVRVVSSLNRSMHALRAAMSRRGFGYVLTLTLIVIFAGAAGMYAFEGAAFESYASALWWTAMLITTIGSQYWPESPEGRVLCLLLSLYGLAMFGYVTATLATFFIGRDEHGRGETPSAESIAALQKEMRALRRELQETRGA
jgi:voltage-gated potassium channel